MENEFVSYNQAIALKELGFDERCFGHYNPNGVFFWKILCSDEDNDHTLSVKDIMEHVADGYVEAPLYQQAFRWFRTKNIDSAIFEKHKDLGKFYGGYTKQESDNFGKSFGSNFKTYEEAESACLDKLIEICKTKTNE